MIITYISKDKRGEHFQRIPLEQFVEEVRSQKYLSAIEVVNLYYPGANDSRNARGDIDLLTVRLPQVCFAAEWENRRGERIAKNVNRLVLLEINHLRDQLLATEVRRMAAQLPYTCLTFLTPDGRGVGIVCKYTERSPQPSDSTVTTEAEERLLAAAYARLSYIYSAQLAVTVDAKEPTLAASCLMTVDADLYYNPDAEPFRTTADNNLTPQAIADQQSVSDYMLTEQLDDERTGWRRRYYACLEAAQEECRAMKDDDDYVEAVLTRLAHGLCQMGVPEDYGVKVTSYNPIYNADRTLTEEIFRTQYNETTFGSAPKKHLKQGQLLTYKTEQFISRHYLMRKNVMTGVAQFCERDGYTFAFRDLTPEAFNTMSIRALKAGLESWDKDLRRYVDSTLIPQYDPVADYLYHLPRWDGKDRVSEFARRVHTKDAHWADDFHVWMLSMVAHWLGKDRRHGNAIVPLIIGRQGGGKSSFAEIILPPELNDYYDDRLSMKNDNDVSMALSRFALINIDEFDALSMAKHPLLKYILSKHDVKFRPPYGKVIVQRRRYASFLATTNNIRPLTDPTGSRRFLCTQADDIDATPNVPYRQLYAQLMAELNEGRRYWFNDEENARIQQQNARYQRVADFETMIRQTFLPPQRIAASPQSPIMPLADIIDLLERRYPTFRRTRGINERLGRVLTQMGYEKSHKTGGISYYIRLTE